MRLKFRKFILYPIMDKLFNYKTKPSYLAPMSVRLASHPATSKKLQELDVRTITYEDWIKYIASYNWSKMNKFEREFFMQKGVDLRNRKYENRR